jgi:2-keto-3-deoxy-L-rhamnonate aldolase RhmA
MPLHELLLSSTLRTQMTTPNSSPVYAGWLQSGDWRTARALAYTFSVVVIDAEHGAIDLDQIALCIEVMAGNNCQTIVRIPFTQDKRAAFARRCLDAGAIGILAPNIQSQEQAFAFIENCYFPTEKTPWGKRGYGYGGCNQDGKAFKEYAAVANDRIIIGCQLEHKDAFEDNTLDDILSTPGLIFTQDGPYDHSGSYLVPGETSDPRVLADLNKYRVCCQKHNVVAGKHVVLPTHENITQALQAGYRFVAVGTDMLAVVQGSMESMRALTSVTTDQ